MLPFTLSLKSGVPIHEQVVYAVRRACVTGQLRPGDAFPSVRALSQALGVNPNTSHKIVATLVDDGLLEVRPGIGTVVSEAKKAAAGVRRAVLDQEAERLVVEAKHVGLTLGDVLGSIEKHWSRTVTRGDEEVRR